MATQPVETTAPPIPLHYRLRLALEVSGVTVDDMAEELDKHPNTVHNYVGGRTRPDRANVATWAMRCGVPFEWLWSGSSLIAGYSTELYAA